MVAKCMHVYPIDYLLKDLRSLNTKFKRGSIRTTTYRGALDFHARLTVDQVKGTPEKINTYFGLIEVYQVEYRNRLSWLNNVGRKNTL